MISQLLKEDTYNSAFGSASVGTQDNTSCEDSAANSSASLKGFGHMAARHTRDNSFVSIEVRKEQKLVTFKSIMNQYE